MINPPTSNQGARRIWADSQGNIWFSEWNAGQLGRYSPENKKWKEWLLPGTSPKAYAVYVDEMDHVWLSDFGTNSLVRFEPQTNKFESYPLPSVDGQVRQLQGRKGEVWGAESGVDKLLVIKTR
jgi:virginiamycin B lyase